MKYQVATSSPGEGDITARHAVLAPLVAAAAGAPILAVTQHPIRPCTPVELQLERLPAGLTALPRASPIAGLQRRTLLQLCGWLTCYRRICFQACGDRISGRCLIAKSTSGSNRLGDLRQVASCVAGSCRRRICSCTRGCRLNIQLSSSGSFRGLRPCAVYTLGRSSGC